MCTFCGRSTSSVLGVDRVAFLVGRLFVRGPHTFGFMKTLLLGSSLAQVHGETPSAEPFADFPAEGPCRGRIHGREHARRRARAAARARLHCGGAGPRRRLSGTTTLVHGGCGGRHGGKTGTGQNACPCKPGIFAFAFSSLNSESDNKAHRSRARRCHGRPVPHRHRLRARRARHRCARFVSGAAAQTRPGPGGARHRRNHGRIDAMGSWLDRAPTAGSCS